MPTLNVIYINYWEIPIDAADVIHTMKMCQAYQQLGHVVTLVAPQAAPTPLIDLWQRYGVQHPFAVRLIPRWRWSRRHMVFWRGVTMALREQKSTIVHTRSSAAALYASLAGIPTIFETHRPLANGMERIYVRLLAKLPAFRKLVAVTEIVRQSYVNYLPQLQAKSIVIHNGVDVAQFAGEHEASFYRQQLGLSEQFTVGYVGSLYEGRGIETILALATRLPDLQFRVVGGTQAEIEQWQQRGNALLPNVDFVTRVPNTLVAQYMQAADVLLLPHQHLVNAYGNTSENIVEYMNPMKLYEYMAARRPIIASDLPRIRDVVGGQLAILCLPDDIEAWQQAIQNVYQHPEDYLPMVAKAYTFVQHKTWEQRVQQILDATVVEK